MLDPILDQGQRPPSIPRRAVVERFVAILREYHLSTIAGDRYAMFKTEFERRWRPLRRTPQTKSELYEALEPLLNRRRVVLIDVPKLEQQLYRQATRYC